MATLQNLIFRLGASSDLVIHSSGAYIETDSYEENKSLWQNKKVCAIYHSSTVID